MDAVTVAKFIQPNQFGRPVAVLPGVFLTLSPRGRDVRAQISVAKPLDPALAALLASTPGGFPLAELDSGA